ncbi:MAG: hypothetical protein ACXWB9_06810, partial [Flavisolibacter sp.]
MKKTSTPLLRRSIQVFTAIILIILFSFFTILSRARQQMNDIWKQLGITIPQANMNIKNSFLYGNFQYYGAKYAKDIAAGDRVAAVNQLVAYAKKHFESTEFKSEYKKYRDRALPKAPERLPVSAESLKAQEKERLERNLKTAESNLTNPNPKISNGAPAAIERIKKDLAALEDPNNPVIKKRLDDAEKSYQAGIKRHEEEMKKFNEKYPEDSRMLLKKRLQEMLDLTEEVDYSAELKE